MRGAYLNRISTAVPPHDVHAAFVGFARNRLGDIRRRAMFGRMERRAQIDHRWSVLSPTMLADRTRADESGFYRCGSFPSTAERMSRYETEAPRLATRAVRGLRLGPTAATVTHLITVSCTGLYAPGLDLEVIRRCGIPESVERTTVGFMGCQAGMVALRLARHIVRSEPDARVLIVCLELCTLHFQDTDRLEELLSFLLWGDGCAAAVVTAQPAGLALHRFRTVLAPQQKDFITWRIENEGFSMFLSPEVPAAVGRLLQRHLSEVLGNASVESVEHWAVHPGGRSVLDAVATAVGLPACALAPSREILSAFGNMSSATVLFVLKRIMDRCRVAERGCALAFGPGLSAESMLFEAV